ncbi:hypothetical protein TRVA0_034S00320 [Trichomonascus vanleenenianus]|uniref:uncharacterized protein n=1 Tax=Trichomonascus vanleenenianus TaxID=2268995 RepID=UPI003EC9B1B3
MNSPFYPGKPANMHHQLSHFNSSPALTSSAQDQQRNQLAVSSSSGSLSQSSSMHHSVTPKTSFDSLGSFKSYGTNMSSFNNPWASNTDALQLDYPRNTQGFGDYESNIYSGLGNGGQLFGRIGPTSAGEMAFDRNLFKHHHPQASQSHPQSQHQPNKTNLAQEIERIGSSFPNDRKYAAVAASRQFEGEIKNNATDWSRATPLKEALENLDPAIEKAFRDMAKSVEEKDREIAELKFQIEAMMTATVIGGSKADKMVLEDVMHKKMDGLEMVHRMMMRFRALRQENEVLGRMLSQGRAAQKEVEIGILRQENLLLKNKLEGTQSEGTEKTNN